jgi:outer membrane protein with beta-barrel domain
MKKLLFTFALVAFATIAFAQGLNFGIKGGANFSILNYDPHTNTFQPGFNAGAVLDIGLHDWSIQPGVFYTTKGEEINNLAVLINGDPAGSTAQHIKLNYIQVPVNFLYHIHAGPALAFYVGGGPYFAYGINGTIAEGEVSNSVNFNSKPDAYSFITFKNPDIGIGLLAGVLFAKKFSADIGYDYGLTHISNEGPIENRVIHLSVGYFFR